ncbi:hypothetical protein RBH29_12520 [Herbivorax sp. ANBcel31]|uniref:hypothetical protein n=1 Tax=Herbivorax sp. ANBcel31 TaxID=3069754 RepID=UPI0027B5D19B|nr:hypothetical protein [Herbivorax sp. ANBcel31]MDQ2087249.1 hypothetical protein [Herbivorax sp. ANBcel31]
MIVTFPHMGNMYIPIKVLLDISDIDYIMPPYSNNKSLEKGVKHSPEFACLPFKTILGDFIYGLENGADFILFGGGCGQCRLGYYGDLQAEILKTLDYKVNFVCMDLSNLSIKEVFNRIKPLTEGKKKLKIVRGIIYAIKTVYMVDKLSKISRHIRCREKNKGDTDKVLSEFHRDAQEKKGYKSIKCLIHSTKDKLKKIPVYKNIKPLKVSIVGEMYVVLNQYMNFEIEKKLGNMGVEVHNCLSVSGWITEYFIKKMIPLKLKNKSVEAGKEYIKTEDIGGHGMHTIGWSILSAKKKMDGVIHIYPFTCLPEIIAQCTFSEIQKKYKIPVMSLLVDEMTGEGGYMTRLEAFVDMIEQAKIKDSHIVSWN